MNQDIAYDARHGLPIGISQNAILGRCDKIQLICPILGLTVGTMTGLKVLMSH